MNVDEIVKALRGKCQMQTEHNCKGCNFAGEELSHPYYRCNLYKIAADQLERLNDFEQSQCAVLLKKVATLEAERDELKANQPVRCGECKHINKTPKNEPYYPGAEKYRCVCLKCGTPTRIDSFCQLGERRGAE